MRKTALFLLLLLAQVAFAQSTVTFPKSGKVATEAYVDSVINARLNAPPPVPAPDPVPVPELSPCDQGPEIQSIWDITSNALAVTFHGNNVFGIDWEILNSYGRVRSGKIEPKSSTLRLAYDLLPTGKYTLRLSGNTCKGVSQQQFEIKDTGVVLPPSPTETVPNARVAERGNYELFMNLTGYGVNSDEPSGMSPEWVERIEAFRYDWGWGITGIRLCMRWYEWEPESGYYNQKGLQKIIDYCRQRGLKLSVFFWPFQSPSFMPEGHYMKGHRGGTYEFERGTRMGSLVSSEVNKKLYDAVFLLANQLASYEGGYYMSIGTAAAEEFINPVINIGRAYPEITGFEPIFQEKFKAYLATKNRPYQIPTVTEWTNGAALHMGNEVGKDFARFISLSLTNYFNNFHDAVQRGSAGKLLTCYMYPDAGNPQNAWYLHANFAAQAAKAQAMYGTDGINAWDNDRKRLCNAINLGMGKISIVEWDAEDLGLPPTDRNCGGFDLAKLEREFAKAYQEGVQVISFAMSFCPSQIQSFSQPIRNLTPYIGKPYTRPDRPVTTVSITPAYWFGQEIYAPHWTGSNYLRPDDTDFWGTGTR